MNESSHKQYFSITEHLAFTTASALCLLIALFFARLLLFVYNIELAHDTPFSSFAEAFFNGLRFDLRVVVLICLPLVLALTTRSAMAARLPLRLWLTLFGSLLILLGLVELDFYREFHQRLNSLVFQYMKEDPVTVLNMLWYGFPVLRLLLAWLILTALLFIAFKKIDQLTRWQPTLNTSSSKSTKPSWQYDLAARLLVLFLCVLVSVALARGTLRQGAPLRWGDAYTTESMFANQLGLNGAMSLYSAAKNHFSKKREGIWKSDLDPDQALSITRKLLTGKHDQLIDVNTAPVRRISTPSTETALPVRNVVVILMESFSGRFVGALGSKDNITPNFDRLTQEGLLFRRFFSNGTHTHQGMFATMACFPNLPGFEYLMQMPEGMHQFSGLPQLLSARNFNDLYVYNGDFSWDNQLGFFSNQGMKRFIGRNDFINPVVSDPTWGVSDQDMFDRGAEELLKLDPSKPFYALLQTLSNHTPYALPDNFPVEPVTGYGSLDQHLTAMRYSDWALGQFFEKVKNSPYYKDTLFVVVGDHGFGANEQLTELDLYRFYVPMLLIAPGIREKFSETTDIVGSQVDIVPTIMARLGGDVQHQCWGRDLLDLPPSDQGFAIIKPSGSGQTVGIVKGEEILIKPKDLETRVYQYHLGENPSVKKRTAIPSDQVLLEQMKAYVQTANNSLINNTTGVGTISAASVSKVID